MTEKIQIAMVLMFLAGAIAGFGIRKFIDSIVIAGYKKLVAAFEEKCKAQNKLCDTLREGRDLSDAMCEKLRVQNELLIQENQKLKEDIKNGCNQTC